MKKMKVNPRFGRSVDNISNEISAEIMLTINIKKTSAYEQKCYSQVRQFNLVQCLISPIQDVCGGGEDV